MSLYFFNIRDGNGSHRDEFGEDLDSLNTARAQTQSILPDIAREQLPDAELHSITCDVPDVTGVSSTGAS